MSGPGPLSRLGAVARCRSAAITQRLRIPAVDDGSRQEKVTVAVGGGLLCAGHTARCMARAAVTQTLHQVGATVPFCGLRRLGTPSKRVAARLHLTAPVARLA